MLAEPDDCTHSMLLSLRSAIAVFATIASLATIASDTTRLQTLQVTAPEESNETGEVVEEEHSVSSARISRDQITFYGKQLGVLLSQEAGIQQRQTGGFGSFSSVTFRGAGSEHTAVYLDGILLNSGAEPVIDLSTLELLNVESIDLYRGMSPMQLGHGSIGGAVNLRSLQTKDSITSTARLGVGALGRRELFFNHQGGRQQWDWLAGASTSRSDNDYHFVNDNRTPLNPDDDARQQRNNNKAERSALLLKAGYQPTQSLRTDVLLQAAERTLGVPGLTNAQDNQARYDTSNSQLHLSQTINDVYGWNSRHSLYQHTGASHYDDRRGQVGLGAQDIESDTRTLGAKSYWETFTSHGTVGLSMDYRRESLDSSDRLFGADTYSANRRQLLATAHLAWFDSSEQWMLAPAIRWLSIDSRTDNRATSDQRARSSHFDPQMGLSWRPSEAMSFSANAAAYFREPSFGELFGSLGLVNSNPSLEPEAGRNYDLGFRYENANVTLSLSAFLAQRSQMIVLRCDSRRV
ncbi:MAG: TonB-dependent receptor, partial [Granulosicoccus sp.]